MDLTFDGILVCRNTGVDGLVSCTFCYAPLHTTSRSRYSPARPYSWNPRVDPLFSFHCSRKVYYSIPFNMPLNRLYSLPTRRIEVDPFLNGEVERDVEVEGVRSITRDRTSPAKHEYNKITVESVTKHGRKMYQ